MSNMVWITFFLTLFSGAITALIGVYVQQWYSQKKARKRLITALKNELEHNLGRVKENLKYLYHLPSSLDERRFVLIVPFMTRTYEMLLMEDPELFYELDEQTNGKFKGMYEKMMVLNSQYPAMSFGLIHFIDLQVAQGDLTVLKEEIKEVLEILENIE